MSQQDEVRRRVESIEGLLLELGRAADPAVGSLARQLVQSLMDLHGEGLRSMLEIVHGSGPFGQQIIDQMGEADPARSLLLLYGLHPLGMETRVLGAIEKTRPYLRSHGGNVELVRVSEAGGVVLRLEGNCHSCPSSAATLQLTVEQAIYDAAPDVTAIVVEGAIPQSPVSFLPLSALQGTNGGKGPDNDDHSHDHPGAEPRPQLDEAQKESDVNIAIL